MVFRTEDGVVVPAVTADQMREVDRIAVEEFGLGILQMMENAGRNLAENVLAMLGGARGEITVLAGSGGNGGGGLCCARHLHNRGYKVWVVLDREAEKLTGPARNQLDILQVAGVAPVASSQAAQAIRRSKIVVDALIGYGLRGIPQGRTAELIELCNTLHSADADGVDPQQAARVLSLDVPSGLPATTGEAPGPVVRPDRTLTLALPKTGLHKAPGELYLADIGIPPEVYGRLGFEFEPFFKNRYWLRLASVSHSIC
jgi:NAD(P)H-hydrate epimerase